MDRRAVGAVLLLLVVLAAVVIPNVIGRPTAGLAGRVPVPAPPSVGTCVDDLTSFSAGEAGQVPPLAVQTARVVGCDGEIGAEIVSVLPGLPSSSPAGRSPRRCAAAIRSYIGDPGLPDPASSLASPPTSSPTDPVFRRIFPSQQVLLGPGPAERILGAAWTACAVRALDGRRYTGSLRNALAGGSLPPAFSLCLPTVGAVDGVFCGAPHQVEVLGYTEGLEGTNPLADAEITRACLDFAAEVTGRADPTYGGQLAVQGVSNEFSALRGTCIVSAGGSKALAGTLVGIADRPVPWAS